ncbi:hypothetical protein ABNQ39_00210 (plasmid) [Azospirillum sp. A26]|uniref:hypothetical protein n=1 Tax=Azospirillum sp. A26 TaxID=3160607 RepID=UPI003673061E
MPSTYSTSLRLELMADGEQSGTWGQKTNTNLGTLLETAIVGQATVALSSTDVTLTANNGVADQARCAMLLLTGTLSASVNVIVPATMKLYDVVNGTSGAFTVTVKTASGSGVSVPQGQRSRLYCNATDVLEFWGSGTTANKLLRLDGSAKIPAVDGSQLTGVTASQVGALPTAGGTMGGAVKETVTVITPSGSTYTMDLSAGNDFDAQTLVSSPVFANPTNLPPSGKVQGFFILTKNPSGGITGMTFGANWTAIGNITPNLSPNKYNGIAGKVYSSGLTTFSIIPGI